MKNGSVVDVATTSWQQAPFDTAGVSLFAVGDVHGCAEQFEGLAREIGRHAADCRRSQLVLLGDIINKGPSSVDVLKLWADDERFEGHARVHRLCGNHEQMLMTIANNLPNAEAAQAWFMSVGGSETLEEMRRRAAKPSAPISRELIAAACGHTVLEKLDRMVSHVTIGNVVFVHAGIDPSAGVAASLSRPCTEFDETHWAWIKAPFLRHVSGFGGQMIVHGHTPPDEYRRLTGGREPHQVRDARLCLDAGSAHTGIVMAAQIETGRYRLIAAQC